MPSPLAHSVAGALLTSGYLGPERHPKAVFGLSWPGMIVVATVLSLLPDMPTILGLLTGDLAAFHNRQEHSLLAGLVVSVVVAWVASRLTATRWTHWFVLAIATYWLHIAMDYLTIGRGVMALWPWSDSRFGAPVRLFYGLHWSEGWMSRRHLWTVLSEVVLLGGLAALFFWRRGRGKGSNRS